MACFGIPKRMCQQKPKSVMIFYKNKRFSMPSITAKWGASAPYIHSIMRMVAAFMFIQAGTMKLFAFPVGMPPSGGTGGIIFTHRPCGST